MRGPFLLTVQLSQQLVKAIGQRLRMEGLVVFDYSKQFSSASEEMSGWIRDGRLKFREEITQGIESLPDLFIGLLNGRNFGRPLAQIRKLP